MRGGGRIYRPADLCRGLRAALEASEGRRRRRARDTRPDAIGLRLRRELIEAVIDDDPEPEEFEGWLVERCVDAGPGNGGIRAMAISIFEEWQLAKIDPSFQGWLREGAPSEDRDPGVSGEVSPRRSRAAGAALPLLIFGLILAPVGCKPPEYGEPPGGRPSAEAVQTAPPGETVDRLRLGADPSLTIYEPPPDLSRRGDGVVFVPSEGRP